MVIGFCRREADRSYRLSMRELPTAEFEAVRAAPEQWVWMDRQWKSAPPTG